MSPQKKRKMNALSVALYFLKAADKEKKLITNLKLQKLVYYTQIWHVVFYNKKVFYEPIEAWMHGPAIPTLYRYFKVFGSNPIQLDNLKDKKLPFNDKQEKFLRNIWNVYGRKYDAGYLEALTHSELPWQEARRGLRLGEHSNNQINLGIAKKYYETRLKASKQRSSKDRKN